MTMLRSAAFLMLVLLTFGDLVHPKPAGERETSAYEESAKVTELRHKLQRLHDILMTSEKNGSSVKEEGAKQHNDPQNSTKEPKVVTGNDDTQNANPQTVPKPKETTIVNNKPRSVSAEDMDRRTMERDTDETELEHLESVKSKREGGNPVQILAKALRQLQSENSKKQQKAAPITKVKKTESDANKNPAVTSTSGQDGQGYEADLLDALARLVEEGEQQAQVKDKTLPLFHGVVEDNSWAKQEPQTPAAKHRHAQGGKTQPSPDQVTGYGQTGNSNDDDDDVDDDDDDDVNNDGLDDEDDDIVKYLQEAGYSLEDLSKGAALSKAQVIEELENRLMWDIRLANNLGISVNDLIQDLEDKAFREALVRRLRRLMDSGR